MTHSASPDFSPDDISDWFWHIIEQAGRDPNRLRQILESMSREDLIRFSHEFTEASLEIAYGPFLDYMDEGTSEDGATDIADWIVSQGKEFYRSIWYHPEKTPPSLSAEQEDASFSGIVDNLYWQKYNEGIPQMEE